MVMVQPNGIARAQVFPLGDAGGWWQQLPSGRVARSIQASSCKSIQLVVFPFFLPNGSFLFEANNTTVSVQITAKCSSVEAASCWVSTQSKMKGSLPLSTESLQAVLVIDSYKSLRMHTFCSTYFMNISLS